MGADTTAAGAPAAVPDKGKGKEAAKTKAADSLPWVEKYRYAQRGQRRSEHLGGAPIRLRPTEEA